MTSRRSFLKTFGAGAALTSAVFSSASAVATKQDKGKPIRIGIIGAENSHTAGYGKMFNVDKKFPGVEVKYVWGETEAFAKTAMEKGSIPAMVKDPKEMMGKIDALIVDHRHAKYHLEAATPFVKAGIPTFIDKPFCYRVEEGKRFLEMARKAGTPVSSYSGVAHSTTTFDIKERIKSMGEINQVVSFGPVDINSQWGSLFFYGVHLVEPLMYIFGEDIVKARITRTGNKAIGNLTFANGMLATLVFTQAYKFEMYAETTKEIVPLDIGHEEAEPGKAYTDMVEMFRTGREPRSHESILKGIAVLEALEKSLQSQEWENVSI
jgi:predicted dehydrogenase